jgi:hypothetical protein
MQQPYLFTLPHPRLCFSCLLHHPVHHSQCGLSSSSVSEARCLSPCPPNYPTPAHTAGVEAFSECVACAQVGGVSSVQCGVHSKAARRQASSCAAAPSPGAALPHTSNSPLAPPSGTPPHFLIMPCSRKASTSTSRMPMHQGERGAAASALPSSPASAPRSLRSARSSPAAPPSFLRWSFFCCRCLGRPLRFLAPLKELPRVPSSLGAAGEAAAAGEAVAAS